MKKPLIIVGVVVVSIASLCILSGIVYVATAGSSGFENKQAQVTALTEELLDQAGDAYIEGEPSEKECPVTIFEDVSSAPSGRQAYASHDVLFGTISQDENGSAMSPVTTDSDPEQVWDDMKSVLSERGFNVDTENDKSEDYVSQRIESSKDGISVTAKFYDYSGRELDAQISFTIRSTDCYTD